jgi:hypothetical protein
VSILLYVHDGGRYLGAAIDAIRAQTHDDWELCVVDDGSTDATASILAAASADPRVRIEHQQARGRDRLHETFNRCLAMARHDLLAVANADDVWLPGKLAAQVAFLEAEPAVDVCWHDATFIDAAGRVTLGGFRRIPSGNVHRNLRARDFVTSNPVPNPTTVFRRSLLSVVGVQEVGWMHDYQFWFKAAARRCEFAGLPDRLIRYRVHEGSHSTSAQRAARIGTERRAVAAAMIERIGLEGLYPELCLVSHDGVNHDGVNHGARADEAYAFAMMHLGGLCWIAQLTDMARTWWEQALATAATPAALHNLAIAALVVDGDRAGGRQLLVQAAAAGVQESTLALAQLTSPSPVTGLVAWHGPRPSLAAVLDHLPTRLPLPPRARLEAGAALVQATAHATVEDLALQLVDAANHDAVVVLSDGPAATATLVAAHDLVSAHLGATTIDLLEVHPDDIPSLLTYWDQAAALH